MKKKTFNRSYCSQVFTNNFLLTQHVRVHTDEKPFSCDLCDKNFRIKQQMLTHRYTHTENERVSCDICGKIFKSKKIFIPHMMSHTGNYPYTCNLCKKGFRTKYQFQKHEMFHRGEEATFPCEVCGKKYASERNLNCYMRSHTGEKPYKCTICDKRFRVSSILSTHMRTHDNEKMPCVCDYCGKRYSTKQTIQAHIIATHTGEFPLTCEVCGRGVATKNGLKMHVITHTGEKAFKCKICDKNFTSKSYLRKHITSHAGEKKLFNCDYCNKGFINKKPLESHIAIHTGDYEYSSKVCGKGIVSKKSLKQHMTLHTGEKPYRCNLCHKEYRLKCNFEIHKRTHTGERPFSCDICQKSFYTKNVMINHKRSHTGEGSFACKICHKTYRHNSAVHSHMKRTHFRRFVCDCCAQQFNHKWKLFTHIKMHMGTNKSTIPGDNILQSKCTRTKRIQCKLPKFSIETAVTDIRKRELKVLITRCDKLPICKNSRQENEMSDQVFGAESFQPSLCMIESVSETTTTARITEFKEPKYEQVIIEEEIVMEDDNEYRGSSKLESKVEESFASTLTNQSLQAFISSDLPAEEYIWKIENDLSKDNDCINMRDDTIESTRIMTIIGEPFMITDCRVIVKRLSKGKQWKLIGTESEDMKPDYSGFLRQMQSCGQGPRNDTKNSDNPEVLKDVIECEETKQFKDYSLNIEFEAIIGRLIKSEKSEPLDDP